MRTNRLLLSLATTFCFYVSGEAINMAGKETQPANSHLAKAIMGNRSFQTVDSMARAVISKGLNAGSGYSQIWARDMNTFIEIAAEESDKNDLRGAILLFFALQQPNDEMIDGYVLKKDFTWYDDTPYYSEAAPNHVAFKNTVETDQETSLIQLIGKYIRKTGDRAILDEVVAGKTVFNRMVLMVDYLMRERYNEQYGLIYGAMTADWGDVQPNDDFGCDMNDLSARAIDVYDNAMLIVALDYLQEMTTEQPLQERWKNLRASLVKNVRKHLWDDSRKKFIPHIA